MFRVGLIKPGQSAQQSGLARAAAAQKRDELARADLEVQIAQYSGVAEDAAEVADLNRRLPGRRCLRLSRGRGGEWMDAGLGHGFWQTHDLMKLGRQASALRSSALTMASAVRPKRA